MSAETKALIVRQPLTPNVWQMVQAIAPVMHKARLFGMSSPEQAAAIMLKGHELGIGLAASFEFIQVIQGKPTLSPRGALALIQQSGELAEMKITEKAGSCTVRMKRVSGIEYELTWTIEDARKTGQVKPGSAWESYQANMLRWRTIGFVADVVFPDILGGLKRADEFGAAVNNDGDIIEGEWTTAPAPVASNGNGHSAITLDDLVAQYGAEAVMEAAGGKIPATVEEVKATAEALNG